ncbi:MAG: shikimate kinase [Coriobacteriales bacterium]
MSEDKQQAQGGDKAPKQGSRKGRGGSARGKGRRPQGRKRAGKQPAVCNKGEHILFVGFMGSGKTSVSRVVAKRAGLPLIDIDAYIEQTQGRTIKQIFAEEGEEGFRRLETQTMAALAYEPKSIISCGGGACNSAINRGILKALGTVVYLKVPLEEAIARISDPSTRPLLNGERPVSEIYEERMPLYRDAADITINTAGKGIGGNVSQVIGALRRNKLI